MPSHLFYLSGCDLRCAFCIAEEKAFNPRLGTPLTSEFLARAVAWGRVRGARNLQWVGGEPTIHLPAILRAMQGCADLPSIVWKSDFYGTPEVFALLEEFVDIAVADFKFGNDRCAERIAGVPRYVEVVTRNLRAVARSELIVRHLLLPGHFDCCFRPVARWMADHLPDAAFSIRDGYQPHWQANRHADLATAIGAEEGRVARDFAAMLRLRIVGRSHRSPEKRVPMQADDESTTSEIEIGTDGRVRVFGASREILESLLRIGVSGEGVAARLAHAAGPTATVHHGEGVSHVVEP